jgi:chromosome segregation protein
MFLKKIELQGFKSFANKTELQFNRNLTAIVGPNGSGKPNIADAIRWATGEQSQKILRTKKAEEVIFAGSDKKSRLGMAEVNLHLDNSDGKIPIDYKEVIITRRVYRTGESEYIINKSKVRLADIQLLLAKASFGQHNYSIIGQGMIDSVLSQSASSRKSFFDEATGVKAYQIKKEKSQHKYTRTQNNLAQSKAILHEISPRLKYLTRQVNKLAKQKEIKEKLEGLQYDYYGFLVSKIKKEIKKIKNELNEKEDSKDKLDKELNKIQEKLNNEESKNSYSQQFEEIQEKYNELTNKKNKLVRDKIVYEGKLNLEFSNNGKDNINWLNSQKTELEEEKSNNNRELSKYKDNFEEIEKELKEKTEKQDEFVSKINIIQSQLEESLENSDESDDNEIKNKIKSLNIKIQEIIKNIDEIGHQDLKKEIYFISKEIEFLNKKINQDDSNEDNRKYKELQNKFQEYLKNKDSYVNEIYELKNNKSLFEIKIKNLEERQSEIESKLEKIILEIKMADSQDKTEAHEEIQKMVKNIDKKINGINEDIDEAKEELDSLNSKNEENRKSLFEMQRKARDIQEELNKQNSKIQDINIELARHQAHEEDLNREIEYEEVDKEKLNYNIEDINKNEIFNEINKYKRQLSQIGGIEEDIQNEFDEVKTKHEFLEKQLIDLEKASQNLKKIIDDLNIKIEERFYLNFKKINETFNKYFQILFSGGHANLTIQKENLKELAKEKEEAEESSSPEITDDKEVLEEKVENKTYEGNKEIISDIVISVKLPGKKQANMTFLSGGEKALTSIALICAIIYNNPSPFVVLDEVDAALDEANSERFAEIVDNLKDKTQFICITHNRATMHKADRLYGVTMDNSSISKLLSISFNQAEKYTD